MLIGGNLMNSALKLISDASLKQEPPIFDIGDTVKVHVLIKEVEKFRIQIF
jgi:large subunit ribosomal protein L19